VSDARAAHRDSVALLFPSLVPIVSFEPVGDGWTCDTYRVNGDWIVQLPRTADAAESLRKQMDVLPELAREVSTAVPVPELVSRDPAAMAYRRIEGLAATTTDGVWPERLGRFLYDLHMVRPEFVGMRARGSEVIRAALEAELATVSRHVLPLLSMDERNRLGGRLGTAMGDERTWRFSPCVTHNDLVAAHVLVNDEGDLAGVIDWEEVAMGDPAADFAWILGEEPDAGERALAAYGGAPDDRFRERCGFYFMVMPCRDVAFGLESGDDELVERGLALLRERGQSH
jgi:aminoglycoside phosphotransferase (APT) family kinase protein